MNNRILYMPLLLGSILCSSVACVPPEALENALLGPTSGFSGPQPEVAPQCFNTRYVQPDQPIARSLDLLFVIDTSGSLAEERGAIADGIDSFVQALPLDVDYRIAVMMAHSSRSNHSGFLWKKGSAKVVLDSQTMTPAEIRADLRHNLTHVSDDPHGDGGELGLFSFMRSVTEQGRIASIRAKGFYREDAALAVVFIADENDICAEYPQGVTPVRDPEGKEVTAKERDCGGVTARSVLDATRSFMGERPFLFGGIVYNDHQTYPRVGENEYGYGYLDLIELSNGISVDLANGNYTRGLSDIGLLVTDRLNLLHDFVLAHSPVDADSIEVWVDGDVADFSYDAGSNNVHVPDAGIARSVIDIRYCLQTSGTGTETETDTGTSTETDTGTSTETETDTGTNTDTGTGTNTDTGSETNTQTGTQTNTGTGTGTGIGGGIGV